MQTLYERVRDEIRGSTNRDKRKLANNTYGTIADDGKITIRLHATDIVTIWPDRVTYDSGGWRTVTTRERMNRYLPGNQGHGFYQDKGVMYLAIAGQHSIFYDGITVHWVGDNNIILLDPLTEDPDKVMRDAINAYVRLHDDRRLGLMLEAASENGARGDCLYCQLGTDDTDHLLAHIVEEYTMAHLVRNALVHAGYVEPMAIMMWYDAGTMHHRMGGIIRRSIRKYLKAKLMHKGLTLPTLGEINADLPVAIHALLEREFDS